MCICVQDWCVFLENWPFSHSVILFFMPNNFPCSESNAAPHTSFPQSIYPLLSVLYLFTRVEKIIFLEESLETFRLMRQMKLMGWVKQLSQDTWLIRVRTGLGTPYFLHQIWVYLSSDSHITVHSTHQWNEFC
jgi:hypothetical protein